MGMFGSDWKKNLATLGATMSDVGGALNHSGGGNIQALQARREYDAQQAERKAALADLFGSAPQPGTPPIVPPAAPAGGYGSAGEAAKAGYMPESPAAVTPGAMPQASGGQLDQQKLMKLAALGIDPTPFLKIREAQTPQYQGFNRDRGVQVFNPVTGKTEYVADPASPNADLERAELEAKIKYYEAQSGAKDSYGDYYAARAKQPYAPPRKSGGRAGAAKLGSHSLPSGAVILR